MFEKVNCMHPDKVADRIAGALVDYVYRKEEDPKIAVEVLIGHGKCHIIAETSIFIPMWFAEDTVKRIAGDMEVIFDQYPQDAHLADNQANEVRCGDNGIFKGTPVTEEQKRLTKLAKDIYKKYRTDGKYILDGDKLVICQSHAEEKDLRDSFLDNHKDAAVNPLGSWAGGPDVDSGATNRKLGSDMGDSVTGGGLCGKDLSKADVSVNIYCWLKAQELGKPVEMNCAIGDTEVNGIPYAEIVEVARGYINDVGGFEKFAEWGLIR